MAFDADAVVVGATLTDLTEIELQGNYDELLLEVENGAVAVTLTDFAVLLKLHQDGEWFTFLSGTDWDAIDIADLYYVDSTGPHEVATGTRAQAIVNIHGAWAIKFQAAGATASVIVRGIVRRV
jgi:hypothetical protein